MAEVRLLQDGPDGEGGHNVLVINESSSSSLDLLVVGLLSSLDIYSFKKIIF